jgi:hypothetical protein
MSGRHLTQARLAELVNKLSERDLAVVATLRRVRLATGVQLERLHFEDTDARHRRRVLAQLVDRRLLARLPRHVGGVRAGSTGYLYALGVAGQRLTDGTGPARGRVQRPWTPGLTFVAHTLAIAELYVRLVEAEREDELVVRSFVTEPHSWRSFHGPGCGRQVLKPDGYVELGIGAHHDHWFVEVDRGTESPVTLVRKFASYRAYWVSGVEHARHGVFPRVLWLVPDDRRHETLAKVAARQPRDSWQLFVVSRFDDAISRFQEGAAP